MNSFIEKSFDYIEYQKQNTCFSAFSLYQSLMILMYTAPESESIKQLQSVLQDSKEDIYSVYQKLSQDKTISIASNIFDKYIKTINNSFKQLMQEKFQFQPEKLESVKQVNNWCAKHTNNKITEIINQINFDTLIISAIHFKDDWKNKFETRLTTNKPFKSFKQQINKPMMHQKLKHPRYFENQQIQMIQLNYENSKLHAVVILPKQIDQKSFKSSLIEGIQNLKNLYSSGAEIIFEMPKFKIESQFALKETMKQLGATKIFQKVDCVETLGKEMKVDEIIQKTFINVDESGTEAAAVTAVMMRLTSCGIREMIIRMICDHPFWFLLVDEQNNVIFTSSVVE